MRDSGVVDKAEEEPPIMIVTVIMKNNKREQVSEVGSSERRMRFVDDGSSRGKHVSPLN